MDNRELDRAIAEKFLGWHNIQWESVGNNQVLRGWQSPSYTARTGIPYYSNDPRACSLVLDEIERKGWHWVWRKSWVNWKFAIIKVGKSARAASDNRYRAVCLAALKAIEEGEK
jgi:hypothetical protein